MNYKNEDKSKSGLNFHNTNARSAGKIPGKIKKLTLQELTNGGGSHQVSIMDLLGTRTRNLQGLSIEFKDEY